MGRRHSCASYNFRFVITFQALFVLMGLTAFSAWAQVAPAGKVTALQGQASIQRGTATITPAIGTAVFQGDRVTTAAASSIVITLSDNSQLDLGASSIEVINLHAKGPSGRIQTRVSLLAGIVRSVVNVTHGPTETFEIQTPNAIAAARGTRYDTSYESGSARPGYPSCKQFTDVEVYKGTVEVSNTLTPSAPHVNVPSGYATVVACGQAPLPAGPIGLTGTSGMGGFRGTMPGVGGAPPPPTLPMGAKPLFNQFRGTAPGIR